MSRPSTSTTVRSLHSSFRRKLEEHDVQLKDDDDKQVTWKPNSSNHPLNWKKPVKAEIYILVCWLEFLMTAISSGGAATADSAKKEYGMSDTLSYFAFITIYLLGQTIGGIFCSPISEVFGRRTIYGIATVLYAAASAVVAAPRSPVGVYVGRFSQGVAAAIPATVAFGSFNDMFDAHSRIWVVYGYTLFGMIGLVTGPIFSTYVTQTIGWRWVYYISTIASGISIIPCIFMKESNADQLLQARVETVKKETGKDSIEAEGDSGSGVSVSDFLQNALFRPLLMLVKEPLVFFCAALCGIAFGLIYGLTEGLNLVYTESPFSFSTTRASLPFIAILIGLILDVFPRIYDDYLLKKYRKEGRRILPETKITGFAFACPSLAIGLWIFAWTIPPRVTDVPWPVSMIGLICIGFSLNDFSHVLFGYVGDSYGEYAASAAGAVSMTRGIMGAVFPLFTTQMFTGLGNNIAVTILASVATAFCFTPFLFIKYGGKLRKRSSMAADDEDCLNDENDHLSNDESNEQEKGKDLEEFEFFPSSTTNLDRTSASQK